MDNNTNNNNSGIIDEVVIEKAKKAIGLEPITVKFKKLDERAVIPTYAHDGDVGMDLTAISMEYDDEKDMYIYHTGLAFETDLHYGMLLFPRSSNRKTDAYLCNHVGIADTAIYRGEIILCFKNRDSARSLAAEEAFRMFLNRILYNDAATPVLTADGGTFKIDMENMRTLAGDAISMIYDYKEQGLYRAPYRVDEKIAQMVIIPYPNVVLHEEKSLSHTEREDGAFGSTRA